MYHLMVLLAPSWQYAKVILAVSDAADTFMDGRTETMAAAAIIVASPLFNLSFNFFNLLTPISFLAVVKTTGLAGGLHCPYKGLLPTCARKAPEGFANCTSFSGLP